MKKLILTSMLASVALFAQSNGTAPAAQPKSTAAPAQSNGQVQAPAATPAPVKKHRHSKVTKPVNPTAAKPAASAKPVTPATPAAPATK
jgi:hypothetical protein